SVLRARVGGRKKRLDTGGPTGLPALRLAAHCHMEKNGAGRAGSPMGRSRLRTPNVSVTTSESTRVTLPTGSVRGTMNQSLPYALAYPVNKRWARSVGPAGTRP